MQDSNFNVLGVADSSGVLKERYEYGPYGQRMTFISPGTNDPYCMASTDSSQKVVTSGSVTQPYGICEVGHQGLLQDEESGLVYDRRRYLSPQTGRFLGRDPLGYWEQMSLYEYLGSSPLLYVDPFGLSRVFGGIDPMTGDPIYYYDDADQMTSPVDIAKGTWNLMRPHPVDNWNAARAGADKMLDPNANAADRWGGGLSWIAHGIFSVADWVPGVGVLENAGRRCLTMSVEKGAEQAAKDALEQTARKAAEEAAAEAAEKIPSKTNAQLRKEWEQANGKPWPIDPITGRNQDVSHTIPKADGGPNTLDNVEPLPHDEHIRRHMDNGDFKRWGARSGGNQTTGGDGSQ